MDRGDDAYGLFLSAIETDSDFRDAISAEGASEEMVSAALTAKGIVLPPPFDRQLVQAIMNITTAEMWSLFEGIRRPLLEIRGSGPIG